MRVSLSQQMQSCLSYIDSASTKLQDAQDRAASGKQILRASDDIAGTDRALSLQSAISTTTQYTNNINVNQPLVNTTQDALSQMVSCVQSIRTTALAAASDSSGTASATYASQLDDDLSQLQDVANTQYLGCYIFSGTATNTAPLQASTGAQPFTYVGDTNVRQTQVMSGIDLPTNIPGSQVFNFDGSGGAGSTDLFTMVTQLKTAIQSGNTASISAQVSNIDSNLNNLLSCSAQVGSWSDRMTSATSVLSSTNDQLQQMLSNTEDVDLAQASIDLQTQQNVYQAALSVSSACSTCPWQARRC